MFLSHPPMATRPSKPSAPATVSIESAITSRDTSEYFMPSVPIEMPSDTVMVLKMTLFAPAASTPAAAARARSSMCTLHGVTWLHVEQTPTTGREKSSRENPTACSIARPAARAGPSTTADENRRGAGTDARWARDDAGFFGRRVGGMPQSLPATARPADHEITRSPEAGITR